MSSVSFSLNVTMEHTLIYKREFFVMKTILWIILVILGLGIGAMFLPAIAGIAIGIVMIRNGSIFGEIIAIAIGLACQAVMLFYIYDVDVPVHGVDECPYCGSGDTDGSHCYSCDEDF